MNYRVLLFYKYVHVTNPDSFMKEHLEFCNANNIKGRVFIASEGINGTVSGTAADIDKYKMHLTSYSEFKDIWFKEDESEQQAFYKMHVRVKEEIVHSGLKNLNPEQGGKRLSPEELFNFYESGKEFVIVDTRNWYESKIGRFKNAVTPPMRNFREWKETVEEMEDLKDKTVITYCTGGIRCEKASAYLVEKGFKDVYQLEGGIVNFTKQYPDTYWEGGVFVFDERRVVEPNSNPELKQIAHCYFCGEKTSYYINCHNLDCDKIIVSCHSCKTANDYCCSDECRRSENRRNRYFG
jgi:UPF0176 protein